MIRRHPTAVSLGPEELQNHLQRIFLRHTVEEDFNHLRLDEEEQSYEDESTLLDASQSSMDSCASSDQPEGDLDLSADSVARKSSALVCTSPSGLETSTSEHAVASSASLMIKPTSPPQRPTHCLSSIQNILPMLPQRRRTQSEDSPRLKVILPRDAMRYRVLVQRMEKQEGPFFLHGAENSDGPIFDPTIIVENRHTHNVEPAMPDELPPFDISPSLIMGVPLRALALASTLSDEAFLADMVSPTTAAKPRERGTPKRDSIPDEVHAISEFSRDLRL